MITIELSLQSENISNVNERQPERIISWEEIDVEIKLTDLASIIEVGHIGIIKNSGGEELYHGEMINHKFVRLYPEKYNDSMVMALSSVNNELEIFIQA